MYDFGPWAVKQLQFAEVSLELGDIYLFNFLFVFGAKLFVAAKIIVSG